MMPPRWPVLEMKRVPPKTEYLHRCLFKLDRMAAWRLTPYPVRLAIRLRVYVCGCGKTHLVETDDIIKGK